MEEVGEGGRRAGRADRKRGGREVAQTATEAAVGLWDDQAEQTCIAQRLDVALVELAAAVDLDGMFTNAVQNRLDAFRTGTFFRVHAFDELLAS